MRTKRYTLINFAVDATMFCVTGGLWLILDLRPGEPKPLTSRRLHGL